MQFFKKIKLSKVNWNYILWQKCLNSEGWHQLHFLKEFWYLDKTNWILRIDTELEDYEKRGFEIEF